MWSKFDVKFCIEWFRYAENWSRSFLYFCESQIIPIMKTDSHFCNLIQKNCTALAIIKEGFYRHQRPNSIYDFIIMWTLSTLHSYWTLQVNVEVKPVLWINGVGPIHFYVKKFCPQHLKTWSYRETPKNNYRSNMNLTRREEGSHSHHQKVCAFSAHGHPCPTSENIQC